MTVKANSAIGVQIGSDNKRKSLIMETPMSQSPFIAVHTSPVVSLKSVTGSDNIPGWYKDTTTNHLWLVNASGLLIGFISSHDGRFFYHTHETDLFSRLSRISDGTKIELIQPSSKDT